MIFEPYKSYLGIVTSRQRRSIRMCSTAVHMRFRVRWIDEVMDCERRNAIDHGFTIHNRPTIPCPYAHIIAAAYLMPLM